jgi:hypothetical protein
MDRNELEKLWGETLRSPAPKVEQFDHFAHGVVDTYVSGDVSFREHIKNRSGRVTKSTGQTFNAEHFDLAMARAFVADEIGFSGWDKLVDSIWNPAGDSRPLLFQYAIAALWRGDFSSLERAIGGSEAFDAQITNWLEAGYFADEPETMAEAFAAACMLGHDGAAASLLDNGVDPYAGMRTGLAGFHYAASSGRLNVIKLLIERKVPTEIKNTYGGTVLGQALWSAIHEHKRDHAAIIEALIDAGAYVWPGTLEWWSGQNVPSAETKEQVASVLQKNGYT